MSISNGIDSEPQKQAKYVSELVPNLKPIVQYCIRFAESARFECIFLKDLEIDPQVVYRNTFSLGLLCVARNILGSSNSLMLSEEFEPIRDALNQMNEFPVPKRLQELANFYGQYKTKDIIVTYKRFADFLLRILDLAVNEFFGSELERESGRIPFYNTSQFCANLNQHLQAQLDVITGQSYKFLVNDSRQMGIERMVRLPNYNLHELNCPIIDLYSNFENFPYTSMRLINDLSKIKSPSSYSEKYGEIGVWFRDTTIGNYSKLVQSKISNINKKAIHILDSLYDCGVYTPKNEGSNKQILSGPEIMSYCLEKKAGIDDDAKIDSDDIIALYFNSKSSVFVKNTQNAVEYMEGTLKNLALN